MSQGVLSDGRPLLMAVAPVTSAKAKAGAICAMAAALEASVHDDGMAAAAYEDDHTLPWRAYNVMAYMVRITTVCTGPAGLLHCCTPECHA